MRQFGAVDDLDNLGIERATLWRVTARVLRALTKDSDSLPCASPSLRWSAKLQGMTWAQAFGVPLRPFCLSYWPSKRYESGSPLRPMPHTTHSHPNSGQSI